MPLFALAIHRRGPIGSVLSAALLLGAPAILHGQAYRADKCGALRQPIGTFTARGSVRYRLATNGTPDTASVEVLSAGPMSIAGFRSAAVRQLSACKMQHPPRPLAVVQQLQFDTGAAALDPAIVATGSESPLAVEATEPPDATAIFSATDPALEERPRWVDCDRAPRTKITTTSGRSMAAESYDSDPADHGLVTAALLVGPDGRVVKDSLTLLRTDNTLATSKLMRSLATCRFAPGRVLGAPFTTRVNATMSLSPNGYSVWTGPVGRSALMAQ